MKAKRTAPKQEDARTSWKTLLRFYRKVKIPWPMLVVVFILSFAVKEAQAQLVPYITLASKDRKARDGERNWRR